MHNCNGSATSWLGNMPSNRLALFLRLQLAKDTASNAACGMLRAHLPCSSASSERCQIYVYRGEGAGWRSVRSATEGLQRLLPDQYEVRTLTAAELLDGSWISKAALLVMPGGADLPYCNRLNGRGNTIIKGFVSSGGSYLGLCAGAYYACSRVQFEEGSCLQVLGDRELCFFPGIACGAAYPGFDYQTEAGAVAADVQFAVPPALAQQLQQQGSTLAQQVNSSSSSSCSSCCFTYDYSNGGPCFITQDRQLDVSVLPGVQVLATYCALPDRHKLQLDQQQQQELQPPPHGPTLTQAAAAVRCSVGSGVAVLCGTHPELAPQWLDECDLSPERPQPSSDALTAAVAPAESALASTRRNVAAAAGKDFVASSKSPQSAVAVLDSAVAAGPATTLQRQDTMEGSHASSLPLRSAEGLSLEVCEDVRLAQHTEALRRVLSASQEQRDLFLSCLLYEALRRG